MDKLRTISAFVFLLILVGVVTASEPQFVDDTKLVKLRWKNTKIKLFVSTSLKNSDKIKTAENFLNVVKRSVETWEKTGDFEFSVAWTNKQSVGSDGTNLITIAETPENSANIAGQTDVAAKTKIFFNKQGTIAESDIVLSPFQLFSTDGTAETFDLESILTHEIGHLLGLDHSNVMGATMFANQSKNDGYSNSALTPRTLSEDDKSGIRSIYGGFLEENCCGTVRGSLSNQTGPPLKNANVWLEEIRTGRVFSAGTTNNFGKFRLDGLLEGNYRLLAQNNPLENETSSNFFDVIVSEQLKVNRAEIVTVDKQVKTRINSGSLTLIGMNEQLAASSLLLNKGQKYFVYLGGKVAGNSNQTVSFPSQYFQLTPKSSLQQHLDDNLISLGFEANISKNASNGDYTVRWQNPDGSFSSLIGAITIDDFANENYSNFWR